MQKASTNILLRKVGATLTCLSFAFLQAVILVPDTLAQAPAPDPTAKTDAPVDIQAAEQEFADDQVIAKGNVKVTYKDSIVRAPLARLFRDATGQAQRAVFVGKPNLTQGANKINADTLIFEIANSKVLATGHAHSEVVSAGDDGTDKKDDGKNVANPFLVAKAASEAKLAKAAGGAPKMKDGKPVIAWPHAGDDDKGQPVAEEPPAPKKEMTAEEQLAATESGAGIDKKAQVKSGGADVPIEKIITDSDYQEYSKEEGKFDATGHVHVLHGDISVYADKLQLVYGLDGKPETALFTGNVDATQLKNNTKSDLMTYYLSSKRLSATGNVRSRVIEQKPPDKKPAPGAKKDELSSNSTGTANGGAANAGTAVHGGQKIDDETVLILSDAQDFNKENGRMQADGNVHVYYQDTTGVGPRAVLYRNELGKAEKVLFLGRSQVQQPGKRWIGDRITFVCADKKILAEGNTKAFLTSTKPTAEKSTSATAVSTSSTGKIADKSTDSSSKTKEGTQ